MTPLVFVGDHAENLQNGSLIGPGSEVDSADLGPEDMYLLAEGRFIHPDGSTAEPPPPTPPTKNELLDRAAALDIAGRTKMTADELAEAIAAAEANTGD